MDENQPQCILSSLILSGFVYCQNTSLLETQFRRDQLHSIRPDVIKTVSPDAGLESVLANKICSLTGETVMTVYIGVDFHPHQQTVAWCDSGTGETGTLKLVHDIQKVREYYSSISAPAIVGVEASTRAAWFENTVIEAGHKLLVGNPVSIRKTALSRHKNDRIDAEHMLWLLMRDEFPAIWRRPPQSNEILEVLRLRFSLVKQRTQVYNRLQALAHNVGMPKVSMRAAAVQQVIKRVEMNESGVLCREQLFSKIGRAS